MWFPLGISHSHKCVFMPWDGSTDIYHVELPVNPHNLKEKSSHVDHHVNLINFTTYSKWVWHVSRLSHTCVYTPYTTASIPSFMGAPHGWVCHELINLEPTKPSSLPNQSIPKYRQRWCANLLSKNEDK